MEKYYEEWNAKKYPVRVVSVEEILRIKVADYELWAAIGFAYSHACVKNHCRAVEIDNEIFYYCDSGFIDSDPTDEEIIEHLKEREVL